MPFWELLFSWLQVDGTWSAAETLRDEYDYVAPQLKIDRTGRVHLMWKFGGLFPGLRYAMRSQSGEWSGPATVVLPSFVQDPCLVVGMDCVPHVLWQESQEAGKSLRTDVYESIRQDDGSWSSPVNVSNTAYSAGTMWAGADGIGNIHLAWGQDTGSRSFSTLRYQVRTVEGTWFRPVPPCTLPSIGVGQICAPHLDGGVSLFGWDSTTSYDDRRYARLLTINKQFGEPFRDTTIVGWLSSYPGIVEGAVVRDGIAHIAWSNCAVDDTLHCSEVYYFEFPLDSR